MIRKKYFSMLAVASFSCIINALLIITDSVICGQMLGEKAVSAISLVAPIYNICIFIAVILSLGIPVLYSRAMGGFQKKEADRVLGCGLFVALIGGGLIFLLVTGSQDAYLAHFQPTEELSRLAKDYLFWVRFELLLMPVAEVMVGTVFADGDEFCTTTVVIVETMTNIILSIVLCRAMGIAGVALASFIAVALRLLVSLTHLLRKTNSLRLNLYFSFSIFRNSIRLAMIDAGNYLSLALFSFVLNHFIIWRFGPEMLIIAAVILVVQEFQLFFDGVGTVITPIISVYLSEMCYAGVRRVWRLASRTAVIMGGIVTLLLISLSGWIPGLLGLKYFGLSDMASRGIILMSFGMISVSWLYLLTSYYRVLDRILLSFSIGVLRDAVCVLGFLFLFGMLFGIYGVFIGIAVGALAAHFLSLGYVYLRYGKENLPLLLADRERDVKSGVFDLTVQPEAIVETRNAVEGFLRENQMEEIVALRCMLVLEDVLMLIYEKNEGRKVLGECALTIFPEKVMLVIRDDGEEYNLTDENMDITSFRSYIITNVLRYWTHEGRHLMTMSFNRNCLEVKREVPKNTIQTN